MPALTEEQKCVAVIAAARYYTPTEICELLKEQFGIDVERNQAQQYNPTTKVGQILSKKYVDLFNETREKFLKELDGIPMANPAVRVMELTKMVYEARKRKNNVLAAQHIEQIAKELGGFYTNKMKLVGGKAEEGDAPVTIDQVLTMAPTEAYKKLIGKA